MYGLKKPSIPGLWKNTKFVCLCLGKDDNNRFIESEFKPTTYGSKLYYECPACRVKVPYYEIEKAIDKIIGFLYDEEDDGSDVNLKNITWKAIEKSAGIKYEYRVLSHRGRNLTVEIKKNSC